MITTSELAGFVSAHGVWCLSNADLFTPLLAYTNENDERQIERFAFDDLNVAIEHGKQKLASNDMNANDAVLIYIGLITVEDKKLDAIIIEMRAYFSPDSEAVLAIPYTTKNTGDFSVYKPKLLVWKNCEDFNINSAFKYFFKGVDSHEEGSVIWNQCLDEFK